MFCPHCGREIANDSAYCCFCGKALPAQNNFNNSAAPDGVNPRVYAPTPAPQAKINGYSIAGFVFSLISVFTSFIYVFSEYGGQTASVVWNFLGGNIILCFAEVILGLAFSIVGTVKSKRTGKGKGFGVAGIVLGAIMLAFWLAILFVLLIFLIGFGVTGII